MLNTSSHLLGVAIPTLGRRADYLKQCLDALTSSNVYVVVVGPEFLKTELDSKAQFVIEHPGDPLAQSINRAVATIPEDVEFVTWVGDDDLLHLEPLLLHLQMYLSTTDVVVYGDCNYIDANNRVFWRNRPGRSATTFMSLLPQRISQPASVIRHSAWKHVGGLDSQYQLAFDYDLFIRLGKLGKFRYIPETFANYRWHQDALSVKSRKFSVQEASRVRSSARSRTMRFLLWGFEVVLMLSTYLFGTWLERKLNL